jgi:hypothetical protein
MFVTRCGNFSLGAAGLGGGVGKERGPLLLFNPLCCRGTEPPGPRDRMPGVPLGDAWAGVAMCFWPYTL